MLAVAFVVPLLMAISHLSTPWVLLSWLAGPRAVDFIRAVEVDAGRTLNHALAGTGQLALMFSVYLAAGLVLGRLLGL
jgi:1,4-dihydroxy-2-naphthoate octaprenyltransferase